MLLWTHSCLHIAVTLSITAALELLAGSPVLRTLFTCSEDLGDISIYHCPMQSFICLTGVLKCCCISLSCAYFWRVCGFLYWQSTITYPYFKKKVPLLLIYCSRDSLFIVLTDHYRACGDAPLYYRLDFYIPVNTDYNQIIKIIFWTPVRPSLMCDFLESKTSDPKTPGINSLSVGFL